VDNTTLLELNVLDAVRVLTVSSSKSHPGTLLFALSKMVEQVTDPESIQLNEPEEWDVVS
jgi:hypothetical protein